mgnify:CR=1 FL=1
MTTTAPDALAVARSLRPLIEAHAASDATPVAHDVVDALEASGLYGGLAPRAVGGLELSLLDNLDLTIEISAADGSTGWCYMACVTTGAFFGAWSGDAFVDREFAAGVPRMAGQLAPNGTARRVEGGYLVSGDYHFASAIDHSELVGMGFLVVDGDAPPEFRMGAVPKSAVDVTGNWDVLGLRATASYDYAARDVFVPEEATFGYAAPGSLAPEHRRGGPRYDLGIMILTCVGHAGWAIGLTRRALDEVTALAPTKHRMGSATRLSESESFLLDLGRLEQRARAADLRVRDVLTRAEAAAAAGTATPALSAEVRSVNAYVTEEAAEIVRACYLMAGTTGLRSGPLERAFRDVHAGSQHAMVNPQHHVEWARHLLPPA